MARYASGKKSQAISDISGAKVPYTQLKTTWNNLRVEPSEFDPKHPQLTPAKNVIDATALYDPRPSTDVENVVIDFAFTSNIFLSRVERSQVGTNIHAKGNVGTVSFLIEQGLTGVQGVGAIGSAAAGVGVSGVAGTTAIGTYLPQDQTDVSASKVTGTTAIGDYQTGAVTTGVQSTGATGTETIEHDRIFELPNGGSVGTGAIGTSAPQTDVISTNIAGTGGSNGADSTAIRPNSDWCYRQLVVLVHLEKKVMVQLNLNCSLQLVLLGTANAGSEVLESEIPESNQNGFGENAFGYGVWGGDGVVKATGGVGASSLDIFNGPNPVDAVQGATTLGAYLVQGNLTVDGVSGTTAIGSYSLFIESFVNVSGVAGTFAIGTESVIVDPGFGEGTYGSQTWGN